MKINFQFENDILFYRGHNALYTDEKTLCVNMQPMNPDGKCRASGLMRFLLPEGLLCSRDTVRVKDKDV